MEGDGGHEAPPLVEELLVTDGCRERESQFISKIQTFNATHLPVKDTTLLVKVYMLAMLG